jgi:hypothetical protein
VPHQQARVVRPLQVIDHQHERRGGAEHVDHRQQALDRRDNRVPGARAGHRDRRTARVVTA